MCLCDSGSIYPLHQVLDRETSYRVIINEQGIDIVISQNCTGEMCTYIHYPDSLTLPPSVSVDIVGCTTMKICLIDKSTIPRKLNVW